MKWFQHDTNASHDAKIKKLILRHGAVGYAVYFHCLELIAGDLTQNNITFELEHDSEIIADNLKINGNAEEAGIDIVNRILKTIIDLQLFTHDNGKVFCYKLATRLDNTISRNAEINKIKNEVSTKLLRSDYKAEENTIEHNKRDENRKDNNTQERAEMFEQFWTLYDKKVGKAKAKKYFIKLKSHDIEPLMKYIDMYKKAIPDKKYRLDPERYIKNRKWEDEIIVSKHTESNTQNMAGYNF
jgi:hypothetical protein